MDADQLKTTVVGFLGAFGVLGALLYFVGVDDLLSTLAGADTRGVLLVVGVTLGWLLAWSLALKVVLSVLGVDIAAWKSFFVFSGAMFNNNVTPFGQAGGEPVTALLISRTADAEYETGLAAIASVDTLNFVPSITLALVGAAYFATEVTFSDRLRIATAAVVVLALGVPLVGYWAWKNRYSLEERVVDTITPAIRKVAGVLPGFSKPRAEGIKERISRFFTAIERVATNPRGLAVALGLSALGWLFQMFGLWLAFGALDVSVPLSVMLFVVPMGAIAGITPLPGGAGGIETVLVFLLVAAPIGVSQTVAFAAVVIYRGAVYWVPVAIGGVVMSFVGVGTFGR